MQTSAPPSPLEQATDPSRPQARTFPALYTAQSLFQLFMVCAFPIHLWFLIMAFMDFGWVSLRTYVWDGLGLISYALLVALVESLAVFLVMLPLGLLLPRRWQAQKRLVVLGSLALWLTILSILTELFGLSGNPVPGWVVSLLTGMEHPLRFLWGLAFVFVILAVAAPLIWMARSSSADNALMSIFERLIVLSSLYIFLDLLAIILIVVRNIAARASVI